MRTCANETRVLALSTRAYLCAGEFQGYPELKEGDRESIPSPDEKYATTDTPGLVNKNMYKPQPKMIFLRSGSVDMASTACKEDNYYPMKTTITFKGIKRPFTNILQCVNKFWIRSCCMRTCVPVSYVLALLLHAYLRVRSFLLA